MDGKLKKSEEWISTTLRSIGDAVIATDEKGVVTFMNPASEALTGWNEKDAAGKLLKEVFNVINEETGESVEDPVVKVIQEGIVVGLANHTLLISKDGKKIPIDDSGAPIRNKKGDIIGVVLVFHDVTGSKKMETALKESEEMYKTFVKTSPDAITVADLDGRIIEVSEKTLELHGFERPEELIGKNALDIIAPEDRKNAAATLNRLMKEGVVKNVELTLIRKDKTRFIGEVNGNLIRDSSGKPKAFMGIMRDVTGRMQTEEALKKRVSEMRALNNLSMRISSRLSPDSVVYNALEEITPAVSCDFALIYLRDEDRLVLRGVRPDLPEFHDPKNIIMRVGDCLCGLAVSKGKSFYSGNVHTDSRCTREECKKSGMNSFAALPLTAENKIIGVMGLASIKARDFSADSAFLEISARQVAVSLQNALLHEKLQAHASELEKNLTDIKIAQAALSEKEKRYRYLFEHSQTINILLGMDGRITDVNESAVNALGYGKTDIIGKDALEFIALTDRERAAESLAKDFSGEYTPPIELNITAKKGVHTFLFSGGHAPLFEKGMQVGILLSAADITEHKKTDEARKESERKYSNLVEKGNDGIILIQDGLMKFANRKIVELTGFSIEEAIEKPFIDFISPEHKEQVMVRYKKRMLGKDVPDRYEIDILSKDGRKIPVEINASVTEYNKKPADMAIIRDVTERRKADKELKRLNRALKVLSECNQAIVRAGDESKLLRDICNNIVYFGGYRLAWIGFAGQDEAKTVRPVAQSGYESRYLDTINVTWADTERGRGPTGTAIRTGKTCICKNILTDPGYAPWRSEAVKRGYASSISLPLISESSILGALNIYSIEPDSFDEDEVKLLAELASDIVYSVTALRTREERRKSEKALKESEEKYRNLFHKSNDAIFIYDANGSIMDVNQKALDLFGYEKPEILSLKIQKLHPQEALEKSKESFEKILKDGPVNFEIDFVKRSGEVFPADVSSSMFEIEGKQVIQKVVRDLTERRRAEESLRESEEKFRNLAEQSPNMIFINRRGKVVYANERCEEILGYKREEFYAPDFDFFKLIAPEHTGLLKEKFSSHIGGVEVEPYEYSLLTKEGKRIESIITTKLINYGMDRAILGIVTDITARKRAEEALQAANERLKYLLESTSAAIYASKTSGDYGATNITENVKQITGYVPREFIDDSDFWINHVHPEDRHRILKELPIVFTLGKHVYEYRFLHKDGTYRWIRDEMNLVRDESGNPVEIVGCWIDVTERIKAEESLRESEEKFRNLAEQSPNMIFIFRRGRIVYANKRCEEITGFKREDFYAPGFNFPALTLPEHAKLITENFGRQLRGEEVIPYEFTIIGKEGNRIDIILTPKVIKYDGEDSILGIITDITSRKRAEENLKRTADELARANAEMETFVYSVAHDLRSPLRSMEGFSDALLEDYAKQMDPTAQDYARRIVAASRRMDTLIQNLLSYSQITRAEIEIKPTDMESVISDALEQMNPKILESNASVVVEKPVPEVLGNRTILSQVISNLLSNSIKFMAPGTKPEIRIWAECSNNLVRLWVEDNGIGIAPEYHALIFRLFERLHSAEEYPGTGIGLAIVAKGVERMGGKAGVESAPGKGSRFWVDLPGVVNKT